MIFKRKQGLLRHPGIVRNLFLKGWRRTTNKPKAYSFEYVIDFCINYKKVPPPCFGAIECSV